MPSSNPLPKLTALIGNGELKIRDEPLPPGVLRQLERLAGSPPEIPVEKLAELYSAPPTTETGGWLILQNLQLVAALAAMNGQSFKLHGRRYATGPSGIVRIDVRLEAKWYGCRVATDQRGGCYILELRGGNHLLLRYMRRGARTVANESPFWGADQWLNRLTHVKPSDLVKPEDKTFHMRKGRANWRIAVADNQTRVEFGPVGGESYAYGRELDCYEDALAWAKKLLAIKRNQGWRLA